MCERTATFCRFMVLGLPPWSLVTVLMKVRHLDASGSASLHNRCTMLHSSAKKQLSFEESRRRVEEDGKELKKN